MGRLWMGLGRLLLPRICLGFLWGRRWLVGRLLVRGLLLLLLVAGLLMGVLLVGWVFIGRLSLVQGRLG